MSYLISLYEKKNWEFEWFKMKKPGVNQVFTIKLYLLASDSNT